MPTAFITRGYVDRIHHEGFQPLRDVIGAFVANGGQICAWGACATPRGINETHLIEGARIVTAAQVVERLTSGAASMDFCACCPPALARRQRGRRRHTHRPARRSVRGGSFETLLRLLRMLAGDARLGAAAYATATGASAP